MALQFWVLSSNTSVASLESWQYKVDRLILNTNMNILMSVCEACPNNITDSLQHFLLECPVYKNINDRNVQEIVDMALCPIWIELSKSVVISLI